MNDAYNFALLVALIISLVFISNEHGKLVEREKFDKILDALKQKRDEKGRLKIKK